MRIRFGGNIARAALTCAVLLASALLLFADGPPQYSDWSEAVIVGPPISSEYFDGMPFIAKNNLDLYFMSDRPGGYGGYDIWVSHRETPDDPWEPPVNLGPEINSEEGEWDSFVTTDGHWLYFVSGRAGGCGSLMDLWVSHRKDKRDDDGWETPKNLGCVLNSPNYDAGPSLFEDEATGQTFLYFSKPSPPAPGSDIWVSTMVGEDHETFGAPTPVAELNSPKTDWAPFVRRRDGLEIIVISARAGSAGQDLWAWTRPTTLDPWSSPVNLGQVNSTSHENRASISWDGTTLYFTSPRPGGAGSNDIYVATRTKLNRTDLCTDDGWRNFTDPVFKNERECVSHFAK